TLTQRGDAEDVLGGPLLTWSTGPPEATLAAALLRDDATFEAGPEPVMDRTVDEPASAVFTGEGFLVARREAIADALRGTVLVAEIGIDARVARARSPLQPGTG